MKPETKWAVRRIRRELEKVGVPTDHLSDKQVLAAIIKMKRSAKKTGVSLGEAIGAFSRFSEEMKDALWNLDDVTQKLGEGLEDG